MHAKKFQNVISLSSQERYEYFVRVVAGHECLWGLQDGEGNWVSAETELGDTYAFWPEQEFAEAAATAEWSDCKAAPIELAVFLNRWVPEMAKAGEMAGVFWHPVELVGKMSNPSCFFRT